MSPVSAVAMPPKDIGISPIISRLHDLLVVSALPPAEVTLTPVQLSAISRKLSATPARLSGGQPTALIPTALKLAACPPIDAVDRFETPSTAGRELVASPKELANLTPETVSAPTRADVLACPEAEATLTAIAANEPERVLIELAEPFVDVAWTPETENEAVRELEAEPVLEVTSTPEIDKLLDRDAEAEPPEEVALPAVAETALAREEVAVPELEDARTPVAASAAALELAALPWLEVALGPCAASEAVRAETAVPPEEVALIPVAATTAVLA